MRNVFVCLFSLAPLAYAAPDLIADFIEPMLQDAHTLPNVTIADNPPDNFELLKRQVGCATGYAACNNLNAPGLCCRTNQVCSADNAGHVACCPINAACTGTIAPVGGPTLPPSSVSATTTTNNPFATITTTSQPSFVQTGGSAVRSTVPNSFYPFAFIPTTYPNAAACSRAYTTCQSDAASCSANLASGRQGVTVSAPNGGATVTAVPSLGPESASQVCASLSSRACYELDVRACAAFGEGNGDGESGAKGWRRGCGNLVGVGAGVAVGLAGELLR